MTPPSSREQIDDAIKQLQAYVAESNGRPVEPLAVPKRRIAPVLGPVARWTLRLLGGLIVVLLPFFVLVRLSVFFYLSVDLHGWIALLAGATATLLLLLAYALWLLRRAKSRWRILKGVTAVLGLTVALYCGYSLLYLSATQAKTEAVRSTYTELHPLLRLAVSTWALADADLVVTDASRRPSDYARMGLPTNENSLHFRQPTGYAHAIDLRTNDRPAWQNALVKAYFQLMGFRTLRHVGTADHLHVSLPLRASARR